MASLNMKNNAKDWLAPGHVLAFNAGVFNSCIPHLKNK